jgi:hypothetical protein
LVAFLFADESPFVAGTDRFDGREAEAVSGEDGPGSDMARSGELMDVERHERIHLDVRLASFLIE